MVVEKIAEKKRFKLNELVLVKFHSLKLLRKHEKFYSIMKIKIYHGNKIKIYLCSQVTQYQFTILEIWKERKEGIKTKPKNTCGFLHHAVEYSTWLKQLRKPLCVGPNIFPCNNQTQLNSCILTLQTMLKNATP